MIRINANHDCCDRDGARLLPFYLAVEEWVARCMPADDYLITWRVGPAVIMGRNQRADLEANLEYCRENGIAVHRRRSGGGCVYADRDNIMTGMIFPSGDVAANFARYTALMAQVLRGMGFDADVSGRNDLTVDGRKVSGAAFYRLPDRSIVHGTMLVDTDMQHMTHAITPSRSKMATHGVQSVQSRITTLRALSPGISVDDVETAILSLADGEYTLTDADLAAVAALEERYRDPRWIFGRRGVLYRASSSRRVAKRIDGAGFFDMVIELTGTGDDAVIADIDISGDFFITDDLDSAIIDRLRGCPLRADAIAAALDGTDTSAAIPGLSTEALVEMLTSCTGRPQPKTEQTQQSTNNIDTSNQQNQHERNVSA